MPKSMLACDVSVFCPSATSDTSKDVPPMSPVMTFSKPAALAMRRAATTPAAGPDSAVRTGSALAVSTDMTPPLDCTIRISAGALSPSSRSSSRAR